MNHATTTLRVSVYYQVILRVALIVERTMNSGVEAYYEGMKVKHV